MRLTFLGTASAEMYPAIFCECPNCTAARRAGGRSIRGNSCALVDDDLLLDLNATGQYVAAQRGISLARVRHLLVTHPHPDHFAPERLKWRRTPLEGVPPFDTESGVWSARYSNVPVLTVHGGAAVWEAFSEAFPQETLEKARYDMRFVQFEPSVWNECEGFSFLPVPANHGPAGYTDSIILRRGGKTLLYALDSGGYTETALETLCGVRYDCVVLEGTFGLGPCGQDRGDSLDGQGHMNLRKNRAMRGKLLERGCITAETPVLLSHLCPHYTPTHETFAPIAAEEGFTLAYDGMTIEF